MDIAFELMINDEIRDREVRLIDENGVQLGVMLTVKAQALAEELVPVQRVRIQIIAQRAHAVPDLSAIPADPAF